MNSTDIWCFFCSCAIRSRICFWIVTSSAVVGSSAISSLGSHAIAIAIITRCCWPPDICDGNMLMRRSGSGMPTSSSSSIARLRAFARRSCPMCSRSTSSIWKPTVNTGLSDVIGSWKIIEMSAPRTSCSSRRDRLDEVAPAVHDLALRIDDRVLGRQQAQDRERRHRLAGAGLAHQRDGRVARNVERDALHRLERRVPVEAEGDRAGRGCGPADRGLVAMRPSAAPPCL